MAIDSDGATSVVSFADINALDGIAKFTLDFDIFWDTITANDGVMGKTTGAAGWRIIAQNATTFSFIFEGVGQMTTAALAASSWDHWCVQYDGTAVGNANRLQFYKNGAAQVITFGAAVPATMASTAAIFRFFLASAASLDGGLANVRIWTDWLGAAIVPQLRHCYVPPVTTNLLIWVPGDDGTTPKNYGGPDQPTGYTAITQRSGPNYKVGMPAL